MVSGEFRVGRAVVIQCASTRSNGDLILGGVVTENTEDIATLDQADVAVGDLLALIIRNGPSPSGQRVTLYHPSLWYGQRASEHVGSCNDIVESVPSNLDGGFFDDVRGGDIETGRPPRD